jgi:hypothetical protein
MLLRGTDVNELTEMKRDGKSLQAIRELTGDDRKTARRYLLEPEAVPEYGPRQQQPSKLDPCKPYLVGRLKAGVWNAEVLLREIRQRGYPGGQTIAGLDAAPASSRFGSRRRDDSKRRPASRRKWTGATWDMRTNRLPDAQSGYQLGEASRVAV